MKNSKGFISGFIIASLLFSLTPSFSESIDAMFNNINISMNGVIVASRGESYTLDNGTTVPYSILFKGTTYLPLREIGRLTGKNITWEGNTSTAGINDKDYINLSITTPNQIVDFKGYNGAFFRIDGKGLYKGRARAQDIILVNGKYMMSLSAARDMLEMIDGNIEIEDSNNQFILGEITLSHSRTYLDESTEIYVNTTESYYRVKFYHTEYPNKYIEYNITKENDDIVMSSPGYN